MKNLSNICDCCGEYVQDCVCVVSKLKAELTAAQDKLSAVTGERDRLRSEYDEFVARMEENFRIILKICGVEYENRGIVALHVQDLASERDKAIAEAAMPRIALESAVMEIRSACPGGKACYCTTPKVTRLTRALASTAAGAGYKSPAEVAELEKDRARLDWLANEGESIAELDYIKADHVPAGWHVIELGYGSGVHIEMASSREEALRKAIDAAKELEKE